MARVTWPLLSDCPCVRIVLSYPRGPDVNFDLLADTGAGSRSSVFEFILGDRPCWLYGNPTGTVDSLSGAYTGTFRIFQVRVRIPALGFDQDVRVLGVPKVTVPPPLAGTACFRFLNRFSYGNFGDPDAFGLER